MGNTWAAGCRDRETHTWTRHHQEASVQTVFPCLDVICHPEVNLPAAWRVMEACTPPCPPTPSTLTLYSHIFACEMTRSGAGAGGQAGKGAKRKQWCPGYTLPLSLNAPPPPHGPGQFMVSCAEVWQRQPSCVWRPNGSVLPTCRVVSLSALLILGLCCTPAEGCQCQTPSTALLWVQNANQESIFCVLFSAFFSLTWRESSVCGCFTGCIMETNGDALIRVVLPRCYWRIWVSGSLQLYHQKSMTSL